MIGKIFSTTATRLLAALISFTIVILNSRNIGPEGIGIIGILILNVSIIATINGVFGGSSLVYFTPRKGLKPLILISVISSFPGIFIVSILYFGLNFINIQTDAIIPSGYFWHIILMSLFQTLFTNNLSLILGKEKIYVHNVLTLVQFFTLIIYLLFEFYFLNNISIASWLKAWYLSQIIPIIISGIFILKLAGNEKESYSLKFTNIIELSKYGFVLQLASIVQLLNYRLPYYFLNAFFPLGVKLGVFTVGTQLSEGLLIPGKSVAMVQYSKIANTVDRKQNIELTLRLLKFTVFITLFLLIIILLIPESFYILIFYFKSFSDIKPVILFLSPGILAMTANMIFSHFLSGIGKPKYNLQASIIGFIAIFISGFILIPSFGLIGAAISTSISYIFSMIFSFYYFNKFAKISIKDLIVSKEDLEYLKYLSSRFLH